LQLEDATAADKGTVDLEVRVGGRRANQQNGSPFHMGQQRILLRFVPAVDFIHKKGGALVVQGAPLVCFADGFADFFDPGKDGIKGDKVAFGAVGDDHGEGGFAVPGGP
jgi:hypothetical protein